MGKECRLDLDVSNMDVFAALAEHLNASQGQTALACAAPGMSHYRIGTLHREVTAEDLHELAKSQQNVAFVTDLEGVPAKRDTICADPTKSMLADGYIQRKSLISFDLNFADTMEDFDQLDDEHKYRHAQVAAHFILAACKQNCLPLWMLVYSGRGLHLHFKLVHPLPVASAGAYARQYKGWCSLLEVLLRQQYKLDRTCRNPARLFRLPCSRNLSVMGESLQSEVFFLDRHADASKFFVDVGTHLKVWTSEPYPKLDPQAFSEATKRQEEVYKRFDCDGHGVWQVLQTEDGCRRRWLCDPLRVEAMTRNKQAQGWGRALVFHDADGNEKRWNMPLAVRAGNGVALRRRLLSMGLHLCLDAEAQVPLMHYLLWSQPEQRVELGAA
ncbi:MAG: DUF927 domain-containing protein [Zetaproteobacteria bacterium]|nr:DUF927 domain-containing protein [Zetaproteobacteria bacterium]